MFLLRAIILYSSIGFTFGGNAPSSGRSTSSRSRSQNPDAGPLNAASTPQSASSSSGPATRPPSTSAASSLREPGENDDWVPASLPWMVSLGQRLNGRHHHICDGTLAFIDNARAGRLVLTTATCAKTINGVARTQAMLQGGRTVNIAKEQWNEEYVGLERALEMDTINPLKNADIGVIAMEEQFRNRTISFEMQRGYYPTPGPAMIASWRNVGRGHYVVVQKAVTVVHPASCMDALERALNGTLNLLYFRVLIDKAAVLCVSGAAGVDVHIPLFLSRGGRHILLGIVVHRMDRYMAFINLHNDIHKGIITVLVEKLIRQMRAAGIN